MTLNYYEQAEQLIKLLGKKEILMRCKEIFSQRNTYRKEYFSSKVDGYRGTYNPAVVLAVTSGLRKGRSVKKPSLHFNGYCYYYGNGRITIAEQYESGEPIAHEIIFQEGEKEYGVNFENDEITALCLNDVRENEANVLLLTLYGEISSGAIPDYTGLCETRSYEEGVLIAGKVAQFYSEGNGVDFEEYCFVHNEKKQVCGYYLEKQFYTLSEEDLKWI